MLHRATPPAMQRSPRARLQVFRPAMRPSPLSRSCANPLTVASATVKDEVSNQEFALAQKFWEGETMRCLGAGTRVKKIAIISVKVYSVAAYVEADRCAKELGVRSRGGFFSDNATDDFCSALMDGAFNKALLIRLLRDVEGQQFVDALNQTLVPRMTLAGETAKLAEFQKLFESKKLVNGTEVALLWNVVGDLEVLVTPPGASRAYDTLQPELRIRSIGLCRGLFEIFLGSASVVPDARKAWASGARGLLESEEVNRATRKGGSG